MGVSGGTIPSRSLYQEVMKKSKGSEPEDTSSQVDTLDYYIDSNMDPHNGPLCEYCLLEEGGGSVCGGSMGAGTFFCVL